MYTSFRYKATLLKPVERELDERLELCREVYNAAIEERRAAHEWNTRRAEGEPRAVINAASQCLELTAAKAVRPDLYRVDAQALQEVLERVQEAYERFFARLQSGGRKGYPHFKRREDYNSITFKQNSWRLEGRRLHLSGIGSLKLFLSRPVLGDVQQVTVKRDAVGDWWVIFSCRNVPAPAVPAPVAGPIGIDMGLEAFLTTSDGERVENPRHVKKARLEMARAHRRVTRRAAKGGRQREAKQIMARRYRALADARRDFHFKTARSLLVRHELVAFEDLGVKPLASGYLAKHVRDAGWAQFFDILEGLGRSLGRPTIASNPRGTSQDCSECGMAPAAGERKTLREREHHCPACGLVLHRDWNAARNILKRGLDKRAEAQPSGSGARGRATTEIRKMTRGSRAASNRHNHSLFDEAEPAINTKSGKDARKQNAPPRAGTALPLPVAQRELRPAHQAVLRGVQVATQAAPSGVTPEEVAAALGTADRQVIDSEYSSEEPYLIATILRLLVHRGALRVSGKRGLASLYVLSGSDVQEAPLCQIGVRTQVVAAAWAAWEAKGGVPLSKAEFLQFVGMRPEYAHLPPETWLNGFNRVCAAKGFEAVRTQPNVAAPPTKFYVPREEPGAHEAGYSKVRRNTRRTA